MLRICRRTLKQPDPSKSKYFDSNQSGMRGQSAAEFRHEQYEKFKKGDNKRTIPLKVRIFLHSFFHMLNFRHQYQKSTAVHDTTQIASLSMLTRKMQSQSCSWVLTRFSFPIVMGESNVREIEYPAIVSFIMRIITRSAYFLVIINMHYRWPKSSQLALMSMFDLSQTIFTL